MSPSGMETAVKSNWTLKDAEAVFERLAKAASSGEPQRVTMPDGSAVVVLSALQYDLMVKRPKTFVEHILDFPKLPEGMDDNTFDDRHEYSPEYPDVKAG